jgi:hypothetical protein
MTITSLIPGLDEIVSRGGPKRRGWAARQTAELFFAQGGSSPWMEF